MSEEAKGANGEDVLADSEPVKPLTLDEARISVAAAVVKSLQRTVVIEHQRLSGPLPLTSVEADNIRLMIQAAAELVLTLETAVKGFAAPRILRATHSTKIFRG